MKSVPRVRSSNVYRITPIPLPQNFGALNYTVLSVYLLAIVGVGVYFAQEQKHR